MLNYIFLGILQGILEWIPISSEGIVSLFSNFLVKENVVSFALFLHLGTFFSAVVYFRKEIAKVIKFQNFKFSLFIIFTTIISLIVGFPLYLSIKHIPSLEILLIVMGGGLFLTGYFNKAKRKFYIKTRYLPIVVGILQGISVIPGISRSGSTIFGLSLGKYSPYEILKISYILSLPITFCSSLYLITFKEVNFNFNAIISLITSFLVGILMLHLLLKYIQKINFSKFCFIFGSLCVIGGIINFFL